jgi:hypothetical protein
LISNETKVGATWAKVLTIWTYFPTHLKAKCDNNNGAPNGKKRMKPLKEGHYPNKGGLKEK